MPKVIDYPTVLKTLTKQGLESLYHNSGAFGFAGGSAVMSRGWIGPEDPSIRESARSLVRQVREPYAERMASLVAELWGDALSGPVWVMPKSHWAYELEFGSREWMPGVLGRVGVDFKELQALNNGAAIEFGSGESEKLQLLVRELLSCLVGSDFQLVFLGHRTICTIHSRQQLWWTTADPIIAGRMDQLLAAGTEIDENG